ncbi:pkip1 [Peridroma alphabaculovirus]|uniref:Pkip1 n=1 Tax=Peridroma alphabaculovirus TaxID=1346829 RepID=A0A068LK64_9ABAC|nr:pkip1 [Peridroma alphabaculovirus]AIE47759.1 pkip1 [Peridroma alphabaculovirus]
MHSSAEMQSRIHQLASKESNLRAQYETKVMAALRKGQFDERVKNELIVMVADQFGLEEQLYALRHNNTIKRQAEFVNHFNDIDYTNEEIEKLLGGDAAYLDTKYNVRSDAAQVLRDTFIKNRDRFVKILKQFVDKRNVYRKNDSTKLLEELVMLKANLIKHLCIMEKIVL